METPNTRSRRKRELENSSSQEDGLRVAWAHDSQLRKAVLQATEDDEITPPTPTQKPRPISSLLKSSSSSSTSEPGSGKSIRPRKRPCRAHRSLPTSIRKDQQTPTSTVGEGSNSLPSMSILSSSTGTSSEKTRLEYLLDRFSLLSSPMDEEKKKRNVVRDYMDVGTPSRNLRPRSTHTSGMMITSTPLKKRSTSTATSASGASSTLKSKSRSDQNVNIGSTPIPLIHQRSKNVDPPLPDTNHTQIFASKPTSFTSQTQNRNPLSPVKGAPRIGLGSQHKSKPPPTTTITSNRAGGWTRTNSGKAFRTPFLDPTTNNGGGVRSSPRKQTSIGVGPVRGPSALPSLPSKTNTAGRSDMSDGRNPSISPKKQSRPQPPNHAKSSSSSSIRPPNMRSSTATSSSSLKSSLPPTPPPVPVDVGFKNYDVGEDEPEDTSFDSFDGIFAGGGEEIERLLRRVDGSA
ncbi:hypothetical protein I302_105915 [Kwoniella bestiolae CBS 10118]|uniref:Uncharacterized protein n=1 Tax=Kwoniella bestiolae CBS 10118 TaxID=1296100 RepID=A0A1B9G2I0_9TREE|nr:hypothetical protein I302_05039 [Kwoniella bestiolae CBS 10118]OCF25226.1 hypothetical protein I302_05039 [Kwoniella bestiolae CBS 10118]